MPATDAANLTARAIIDANLYLVLATADGTGRPWSSPVCFAHDAYTEFLWVSAPEAAHSRNIAARPQIGIAIFDSRAPIGTGQVVYTSAAAEQVGRDDLTRGIETFSQRSLAHGGDEWTVKHVHAQSGLQLYRAIPSRTRFSPRTGAPTTASPRTPPDSSDPPDRRSPQPDTKAQVSTAQVAKTTVYKTPNVQPTWARRR